MGSLALCKIAFQTSGIDSMTFQYLNDLRFSSLIIVAATGGWSTTCRSQWILPGVYERFACHLLTKVAPDIVRIDWRIHALASSLPPNRIVYDFQQL